MLLSKIILAVIIALIPKFLPFLYSVDTETIPDSTNLSTHSTKISSRKLGAKLVIEQVSGLSYSKKRTFKRKASDDSAINTSAEKTIIELKGINQWPRELIYDQGNLGSCTANALAFCIRYLSIRNSNHHTNFTSNPELISPSRLYFYYNARYLVGLIKKKSIIKKDAGVSLEESIEALQRYGCCPETFSEEMECFLGSISYDGWGYNKKNFSIQPSPESYRLAFELTNNSLKEDGSNAKNATPNPYAVIAQNICCVDLYAKYNKRNNRALSKRQENTLIKEFKDVLNKNIPIFFGVSHDENFNDNNNGFITTPNKKNFSSTNAHAIAIVGYGKYNLKKPNANYFKFINSHGFDWGDKGFGYLEEDYVTAHNIFSCEAYSIDLPKVAK